MMMWDRVTIFGISICLLISTSVIGGSEEDPEIIDEEGDAYPQSVVDPLPKNHEHLDIFSVWFVDDSNETFNVTMKLNNTADPVENTFYNVNWDFNNVTYFIELNVTGNLEYRYGITWYWEKTEIRGNISGMWIPGNPGYIVWTVSKTEVGDPYPGDNLTDTNTGSGEWDGDIREWFDGMNGTNFTLTWIDTDGDGIQNEEDSDDDNDGIPDLMDDDNNTRPSEIPGKPIVKNETQDISMPYFIVAILFSSILISLFAKKKFVS